MKQRFPARFAKLIALSRTAKAALAMGADLTACSSALFAALVLQQGWPTTTSMRWWLLPTAGVISVSVLYAMQSYRMVFRFVSARVMTAGALGLALATVLIERLDTWISQADLPYSVFVVFWVLALLYLVASRAVVREVLHLRRSPRRSPTMERVLIYGAGSTGAHLAHALRESGEYIPLAFIDTDPTLQGRKVADLEVRSPQHLAALIYDQRITSVLLAVPSHTRAQRQAILKSLEPYPVHVRTVPDISDIVTGHASVADIRDVDAGDLLGRDSVPPNAKLLDACIRGKSVLVTGAGGSIGSELCRQIIRLGPSRLVLLEMSEAALYQIDRELKNLLSEIAPIEIVALLGNAHHRPRMREILRSYAVQTVYHAAAYKHVPIVEYNMIEGIHNNVFSTYYTADAALECEVETFVLISSDKAVNPTNVMGATKRFAELTLQALQSRTTATRFCMVRFGNVLESSGSVVPLFREQIKRGGPVTVTHRDIIRYFMTIPEAAQLVLQAGSMGQGGDVFVLNMGEPVRIDDLARRMITLMGLTVKTPDTPEGDIEIVYTGLRPAEKLYEELLIGGNVTGTEHPMIMRAMEHSLNWMEMKRLLDDMLRALGRFDCERARTLLQQAVHEYRGDNGIQDLVWMCSRDERPVLTSVPLGDRDGPWAIAAGGLPN